MRGGAWAREDGLGGGGRVTQGIVGPEKEVFLPENNGKARNSFK